MMKDQVKEILNHVLTWPPERQAEVAEVVTLMEAQDKSTLRLTDEQAAEVRRRLANPCAKRLLAEEVFRRFRPSGTGESRSILPRAMNSIVPSNGLPRTTACSV